MKTIKATILASILAVCAFGQANTLTPTTLSAAITSRASKVLTVTSATGITAPTVFGGNPAVDLYIDREMMSVTSVNGTQITVVRGVSGTVATYHASGAYVFFGAPNLFYQGSANNGGVAGVLPTGGGACTRSTLQVVPAINVETGTISDCLGGQWVTGVRTTNANNQYHMKFPDQGYVAYSATGSDVTLGTTTLYCMEVNLPYNKLLTGIALLNGGTTNGGNKHYVVLYDNGGTALANSAVAGATTTNTANVYQAYAFGSQYNAVGPAQYFA